MPDPALPRPRFLPGHVLYVRHYVDALRRPMDGTLTLTPKARSTTDGHVIVAAPVTVQLELGTLQIHLPPGLYKVRAQLKTVDGALVVDEEDITVEAPAS